MSLVFNLLSTIQSHLSAQTLHHKANHSSILDSLFTWDPVVIGTAYFLHLAGAFTL